MTPAANPRNTRWASALLRPRNRNTAAAPSVVMRKVNPVPRAAQASACSIAASFAVEVVAGGSVPRAGSLPHAPARWHHSKRRQPSGRLP